MKPRRIHLREERPEDQEFLYQLYASTRAEEMKLAPWDAAQKEAFLRSQFQLQTLDFHRHYGEASFRLILDEDVPIGRLYTDRTGSAIHILDIAVIPERRREGIGAAIIRDLQTEAARARKSLTLYVEIFNPARELYKRLGFRPIQDEGVYMLLEWTPE